MDNSLIETELEEIESRIDRLRSLYEQFFIGIEKLEPQIARKDVERRMHALRKEQIRNTGLRYKFQMLVQRFNTMQQYWGRTLREIENGTYRRDVLRAAKRFGEKAALTTVSRKKAERYAVLLKAQEDQRASGAAIIAAGMGVPLAAPPPVIPARIAAAGATSAEATASMSTALRWGRIPRRAVAAAPGVSPSTPPPKLDAKVDDPSAGKKKVAALAAEMKALRTPSTAPSAMGPLDLDLEEDSSRHKSARPRRHSTGKMAAVSQRSATSAEAPRPKDSEPHRKTSSRNMRAVKPSSQQATPSPVVPPHPPPHRGPPPVPPPRPHASQAAGARPPGVPPPKPPAPPAPVPRQPEPPPRAPASTNELPEQRLRQIYAKYLETKQSVNESTAGVTFEKMAASLKSQAEKLREVHAAKSIDYEVVVKNGKTMLKPILR